MGDQAAAVAVANMVVAVEALLHDVVFGDVEQKQQLGLVQQEESGLMRAFSNRDPVVLDEQDKSIVLQPWAAAS